MTRIDDACPSPAELANDDDYARLYQEHLYPNLLTDNVDAFGGVTIRKRGRYRHARPQAPIRRSWRCAWR